MGIDEGSYVADINRGGDQATDFTGRDYGSSLATLSKLYRYSALDWVLDVDTPFRLRKKTVAQCEAKFFTLVTPLVQGRASQRQMVDVLLNCGALFPFTLDDLGEWIVSLRNPEDLSAVAIWEHLCCVLETPSNVWDIQDELKTATWQAIRVANPKDIDGTSLATKFVRRIQTLARKCRDGVLEQNARALLYFDQGLEGVDFASEWRQSSLRQRESGRETPSEFSQRLGTIASFHSAELLFEAKKEK